MARDRPKIRMKTVVRLLDRCLHYGDCSGCPYGDAGTGCRGRLAEDALYYLRQTLEKSEKRRKE